MNLHHFFAGKLRKEETASAYLATLLEHDEAFRRAFLELVLPGQATDDAWTVNVEASNVDITLRSPRWLVIIENKLFAGALQQGQLLRYYRAAIEGARTSRIAAVYLAPGALGQEEVERVRTCDELHARPGDVVHHLPWEALADIVAAGGDALRWFATTGFAHVLEAIRRGRQPVYIAREGTVREQLRTGLTRVRDALQREGPFEWMRWSSRYREEVYTVRAPVTVSVGVVFDADKDLPGDAAAPGPSLVARAALAARVRRSPAFMAAWSAATAGDGLTVTGVGTLVRRYEKWLEWTNPVDGVEAALDGALEVAWRIQEVVAEVVERAALDEREHPFNDRWFAQVENVHRWLAGDCSEAFELVDGDRGEDYWAAAYYLCRLILGWNDCGGALRRAGAGEGTDDVDGPLAVLRRGWGDRLDVLGLWAWLHGEKGIANHPARRAADYGDEARVSCAQAGLRTFRFNGGWDERHLDHVRAAAESRLYGHHAPLTVDAVRADRRIIAIVERLDQWPATLASIATTLTGSEPPSWRIEVVARREGFLGQWRRCWTCQRWFQGRWTDHALGHAA